MDLEEITKPVTLRNPRNLLAVTTAVGWVVPTPLALSLLWASDHPPSMGLPWFRPLRPWPVDLVADVISDSWFTHSPGEA